MAYSPPTIGAAGLTIPTYQDILQYYIQQFQNIYGTGIYLGNDSAQYQEISVFSLKVSDALQALQLVYFNRGPSTAMGPGLDGIVKLNGLARNTASNSSVQLTITGTPGTVIINGSARDQNSFIWFLPTTVTIPAGGTITVIATCQTIGTVAAQAGTINIINSPTAGWTSVTNPSDAVAGAPTEADSQLRARQAISAALPSQTRLQGTIAALEATAGVTRLLVSENYTNVPDIYGFPPHSITATVEGGADADIAQVIYNNKSIGCYTNGTTEISIVNPSTGVSTAIRFNRPTYIPFTVILTVYLINAAPAIQNDILNAANNYLNSLQIGELLTVSGIYAVVMALNPDITQPIFSVQSVLIGYTDVIVNINGIAAGGANYIIGDKVLIAQPGSSIGAVAEVITIGVGGAVTSVLLIRNGVTYTTGFNVPTVILPPGVGQGGGVGSGLTLDITAGNHVGTLDIAVGPTEVAQGGNASIGVV